MNDLSISIWAVIHWLSRPPPNECNTIWYNSCKHYLCETHTTKTYLCVLEKCEVTPVVTFEPALYGAVVLDLIIFWRMRGATINNSSRPHVNFVVSQQLIQNAAVLRPSHGSDITLKHFSCLPVSFKVDEIFPLVVRGLKGAYFLDRWVAFKSLKSSGCEVLSTCQTKKESEYVNLAFRKLWWKFFTTCWYLIDQMILH